MNISELSKAVAAIIGASEPEAKAAIIAGFDQIACAAAKGEEVPFQGSTSSPSRIVRSVKVAI